jgi:hypothetical protein
MRDDDFDYDDDNGCDEDAFSGSLIWLGHSQIEDLIRLRAKQYADMPDSTLLALIKVVLSGYDQFLSPEQIEELWDMVSFWLHEDAKERNPGISYETCERLVRQYMPRERGSTPREQPPPKAEGKRKSKRKRSK